MFFKFVCGNNVFCEFLGFYCVCVVKGFFELLFRNNEYYRLLIFIDVGFRLSYFKYVKYILGFV